MLTPLGVLREPHIASGRNPGPGQRVGVLDKQVGRRPAIRSLFEVRLRAEMNLHAIKGDEAVSAAVPLAGTETKPAVVGKGSGQVTDREDRRYSRAHDCNLSRPTRAVPPWLAKERSLAGSPAGTCEPGGAGRRVAACRLFISRAGHGCGLPAWQVLQGVLKPRALLGR